MEDESATAPPEITYEETPVITPIGTPPGKEAGAAPSTPKKQSFFSFLKGFFVFILLFALGYALSGFIRNAINTGIPKQTTERETSPSGRLTLDVQESTPAATGASSLVWKYYSPVNGGTRKPIDTIQFQLPASVLPPICDGSACGSQGTYLPGGTRFTVAARGAGQVLADFRGKIISDAGGKPFATKQKTIAGKQATEFSTAATGSTIGGYAFSTMHGYMIEVTDVLSLEINHFAPSGIQADFAADDALFEAIVATLTFNGVGTEKGSAFLPTPTAATSTGNFITPIR